MLLSILLTFVLPVWSSFSPGKCAYLFADTANSIESEVKHFSQDDIKQFLSILDAGRASNYNRGTSLKQLEWHLKSNSNDVIEFYTVNGLPRFAQITEDIILKYLSWYFQRYQGSHLNDLKESSLSRALLAHGANLHSDETAKESLVRISKENVQRLTQKIYSTTPENAAAEDVVAALEFRATHHGQVWEAIKSPLVSSAQLEAMGLDGGLNTASFNKIFLQSDDNIFFFALFEPKSAPVDIRRSEYGKGVLQINSKYAEEEGWISAFVMRPIDLDQAGKRIAPEVDASSERTLIKEKLYRVDFTVQDWTKLIKNQLLLSLNYYRTSDPVKYNQFIDELKKGLFLSKNLDELAFEPLGIPSSWEFKVPVSVPAEKLRFIK